MLMSYNHDDSHKSWQCCKTAGLDDKVGFSEVLNNSTVPCSLLSVREELNPNSVLLKFSLPTIVEEDCNLLTFHTWKLECCLNPEMKCFNIRLWASKKHD